MKERLQIESRDVVVPPGAADVVSARAHLLLGEFPGVTRCHIVVEKPHRHHRTGRIFHIDIRVALPGSELVADRIHTAGHENIYQAINGAFHAIRRQLRSQTRRHRLNSRATRRRAN